GAGVALVDRKIEVGTIHVGIGFQRDRLGPGLLVKRGQFEIGLEYVLLLGGVKRGGDLLRGGLFAAVVERQFELAVGVVRLPLGRRRNLVGARLLGLRRRLAFVGLQLQFELAAGRLVFERDAAVGRGLQVDAAVAGLEAAAGHGADLNLVA